MSEPVIIYTGKSCGPCIGTKAGFKARGVPFVERHAPDFIEQIEELREKHGLNRDLPFVVAGDQVWNGFQPNRIGDVAAWAAE